MKNIFLLVSVIFIAGCASSAVDPFFNIDHMCNRFYDENKRWPGTEGELKEFGLKNSVINTDWDSISALSIMKISDDQVYITYEMQRWYGKEKVSGSVYRPIIVIKIKANKDPSAENNTE